MVLTSNQVLIVKELFSHPLTSLSASSLRTLGMSLSEWSKESKELLETRVIVRSGRGFRLAWYHQAAREAIRIVNEQALRSLRHHSLWSGEFSAGAHNALFSFAIPRPKNRVLILLVAHPSRHRSVKKYCADFSLASEQLFDTKVLSVEEFLLGCQAEGVVVQALSQGVVLFGLHSLCDALS
jgi:hypothetical protein